MLVIVKLYVCLSLQVNILCMCYWKLAYDFSFFGNNANRCAYNQQGSLAKSPTSMDGLLGLSSAVVSLPSQLAEQGLVKHIFAHCIAGDGGEGGYLFLGDKLLPSRGLTWAPLLGKPAMCVVCQ